MRQVPREQRYEAPKIKQYFNETALQTFRNSAWNVDPSDFFQLKCVDYSSTLAPKHHQIIENKLVRKRQKIILKSTYTNWKIICIVGWNIDDLGYLHQE